MKRDDKMLIQFTNINISLLSSNSGVFTGENSQTNWQLTLKSNSGFGTISGSHNVASNNVNIVTDNDGIDLYSPQSQNDNQPVIQS